MVVLLSSKGEELRAPRHASAAATRDGNLPVFPTLTIFIIPREVTLFPIIYISSISKLLTLL